MEQHAQQAPHQARHQWRCWLRQLRGAHRALSVHVDRTLSHLMSSHTSWLKSWVFSDSSMVIIMAHPLWLYSPFLLPPFLPVFHRILPPLRAVLRARQPDRHGKPALLRQQGDWGRPRRPHFPHRLRAQLRDLRRAQRLFRFPSPTLPRHRTRT